MSEWLPAAPADSLARLPPEELADARMSLQPGLRTVESTFPVWSVWQANQPGAPGDAVDPSLGPQQVVVAPRCRRARAALGAGSIGSGSSSNWPPAARSKQALDASGLAVEHLGESLAWLFGAGLVTAVIASQESTEREGPA